MNTPFSKSFFWYFVGMFTATVPTPFLVAFFDPPGAFFLSVGESIPGFWTTFWNVLPDTAGMALECFILVTLTTTPLYLLFRLGVPCRACPSKWIFFTAWLAGVINYSVMAYFMNAMGKAVKRLNDIPPGYFDLRDYWDAGGFYALPFIASIMAFFPTVLLSLYSRHRQFTTSPPKY